ncbi:DoxX family protein [Parendozoicomonas sp. Alg238-R29]|uniref:DoxX family protein n=1 Tax=Parendozoicomonas sp. Alg238-R29 TaxID=2993446 RepID=UPI00248D7354|nr:DoxX family protein [Parendozoicomonas sp. Alg238-R29]
MNNTSPFRALFNVYEGFERLLNHLQPVALAGTRAYIAWVFFSAGLLKINDWETTLFLFELEYAVPFLSPVTAAYLGTFGELFFPALLFFGLFGRIGAIGLSFVNVVAVVSLEEIAPAALTLHILWGALLAAVVLWGSGKLSIDNLLKSSD